MNDNGSATLYAELRSYIAGIGPVSAGELLDDVSLIDQGAVDSLGLVEIQLYLESRLGREIQPEEFRDGTLLCITSIVDWLETAARDNTGAGR